MSVQLLGPWTMATELAAGGGGKARGLAKLSECAVSVPDWVVIDTEVFEFFITATGLDGMLEQLGAAVDGDSAESAASQLREAILRTALPTEVDRVLAEAAARFDGKRVAVRSSAAEEDGTELTFAGQFDTVLGVQGEPEIRAAVRKCWASAFSPRRIAYGQAHGVGAHGAVAVIVQRLVDAEISGVTFTVNPMTGATDQTVISAVYGLGEGLVSGLVDADTLVIADDGSIVESVVGEKEVQMVPSDDGGAVAKPVEPALRDRAALTTDQARQLQTAASHIAEWLGAPQDIEWAYADNTFWYLQARPITATAPSGAGVDLAGTDRPSARLDESALLIGAGEQVAADDVRIWDNSNIIESFSGLTSPLTYTTAADIYGRVYRGYAESLRVPAAQLRQIDEWTPVMLGYFHGRVYYNLVHWYRMVGIAPGYPLNRKVLEAALGVAEPLDRSTARRLKPFTFANPVARLIARTITTATYIRRMRTIDDLVEDFLTEFYRVYDRFEKRDVDALSGEQAYHTYREVEGDLVTRWGPLMVLDAILLTLTGAMFLATKVLLPKAPEWVLYAIVGPGADVESAEPARAMIALAQHAAADPQIASIVIEKSPESVYGELNRAGHHDFTALVDDYVTRYGYRSLDELKLEVPDLREDPSSLFVMLRSALARTRDEDGPTVGGAPSADAAQVYLDTHLHGIRRRGYDRLRHKLSRCAAHRERLRFARTRAFGMVKRLIRVMGRDLAERGVIEEFTDVFELTVTELRRCYVSGAADDVTNTVDLMSKVTARRAARRRDAGLVAPERFRTRGGEFGEDALAEQGWVAVSQTAAAEVGTTLVGTPSCAGIVEATAHVVSEPRGVDGGVLVAYRTDPGWVAALPSASALVIERGSPLTHVAIVARELGVPTVVQLRDATALLRTGMRIRVDGSAGTVAILADPAPDSDSEPQGSAEYPDSDATTAQVVTTAGGEDNA